MQNPSPEPVSPPFNKAASLSEEEQIRLKIASQKSPLLERAYRRVERQGEKHQAEIAKRYEDNRQASVEAMKRDVLDKKMKENHPELKPKDLPTVTREQLAKEAQKNAEASYEVQKKAALENARQESLKEKRAFLAEIVGPQNLKQQFNQASLGR